MASEVNAQGVPVPEVGDGVLYVPEQGKVWAAVVTGIVEGTMVNVTAFPPGENPRGIERAISYDGNAGDDTWHWQTKDSGVQDVFAELPDLSNDPEARQARIEELGG